jgi:hypothetical protein
MVINLTPPLEAAISEQAKRRGVDPEKLALDVLRDRFLPVEPRDEWERKLFEAAVDCGFSPPDWALSREALYD